MNQYIFLRISDVSKLIGMSESAIYALRDPISDAHDPTFPAAVALSPRCVRWRSDELQAWMDSKSINRATGSADRKAQARKAGKAGVAARKVKASAIELAGQA
jgi:predicted DNA-binding transcriptional regulator AlpA